MLVLFTIIGVVAVASWAVAVWSGLRLVSLSQSGGGFQTLIDLGWWRIAAIEQRIGIEARTHTARYRQAFITFFLSITAGAATGVAANLIDAPAH